MRSCAYTVHSESYFRIYHIFSSPLVRRCHLKQNKFVFENYLRSKCIFPLSPGIGI
ncbi:hypothetical protein EG68_04265 [Paragonimus skrjabini miyazakii]|uniref:Uncharacterized protein n=1 Tax=Paragonimus skrjabini miyazakii TaxID=59628 RepID=A0A8S9Z5B8_9TREM|nr:hypothetical protein EG68_04265 [Paragonimus skrjabini miyazakii]